MRAYYVSNILIIFALLGGMTCRKASLEIDSTLSRVEASMVLFDKVLRSSEEGWLVEATAPRRYNRVQFFWMKFNSEGRVTMISDHGSWTLEEKESSYRLRQRQQPTLSFDTYNYISEFADPDQNFGTSGGIDFEYVFSVALADSLRVLEKSGVALTDIKQFEMLGKTFGSKAVFIRGSKTSVLKKFHIVNVLDSLKPKDNNTVRILKIGTKEYHYNLQLLGLGNPHTDVLALTDLKTKKAIPMSFYFDLQGRMHFRPASSSVGTLLPRDKELEQQVKNWVFIFSEDVGTNINKSELNFTKTDTLGENEEKGMLLSKKIDDIGYIYENSDSVMWALRTSEINIVPIGWQFTGIEKNFRKNATRVLDAPDFFDVNLFNRINVLYDKMRYKNSFVVWNGKPVGIFTNYKQLGKTICLQDSFHLFIYDEWQHLGLEPLVQDLGYVYKSEERRTYKDGETNNGEKITSRKAYYTPNAIEFINIPVCLGFEWHCKNKNIMIAFYQP